MQLLINQHMLHFLILCARFMWVRLLFRWHGGRLMASESVWYRVLYFDFVANARKISRKRFGGLERLFHGIFDFRSRAVLLEGLHFQNIIFCSINAISQYKLVSLDAIPVLCFITFLFSLTIAFNSIYSAQ